MAVELDEISSLIGEMRADIRNMTKKVDALTSQNENMMRRIEKIELEHARKAGFVGALTAGGILLVKFLLEKIGITWTG